MAIKFTRQKNNFNIQSLKYLTQKTRLYCDILFAHPDKIHCSLSPFTGFAINRVILIYTQCLCQIISAPAQIISCELLLSLLFDFGSYQFSLQHRLRLCLYCTFLSTVCISYWYSPTSADRYAVQNGTRNISSFWSVLGREEAMLFNIRFNLGLYVK